MHYAICALLLVAVLSESGCANDAQQQPPRITDVSTARSDTIEVVFEAQQRISGKLVDHEPQPDDKIAYPDDHRLLVRARVEIGALAGPDDDKLRLLDRLLGRKLDLQWADDSRSEAGAPPGDIVAPYRGLVQCTVQAVSPPAAVPRAKADGANCRRGPNDTTIQH